MIKIIKRNITLLIILAVAAGLRFYGLEIQSLCNDELVSVLLNSHDSLVSIVKDWLFNELSPPLYLATLLVFMQFLGDAEWALRLPSAFAGLAGVWAMYHLGRRAYSRECGLIAAALATVLYVHVYYSQEARTYILLIAAATWLLYEWIAYVRSLDSDAKPPRNTVLRFSAASLLTSYLHYSGLAFVIFLYFLTFIRLYLRRKPVSPFMKLTAIQAILMLPAVALSFFHFGRNMGWIQRPQLSDLGEFYIHLLNNSLAITVIVLMIVATSFWRSSRYSKPGSTINLITRSEWLMAYIILGLPIGFWVFSLTLRPIFAPRFLLVVVAPLILLCAQSVCNLLKSQRLLVASAFVILVLGCADLIVLKQYYTRPHKEQFREAAHYVVERWDRFENARIVSYTWRTTYFDYYFKKFGSEIRVEMVAGSASDTDDIDTFLENAQPKYFWYMAGHRVPETEFLEHLDRNYKLLDKKTYIGASVRLYRYSREQPQQGVRR